MVAAVQHFLAQGSQIFADFTLLRGYRLSPCPRGYIFFGRFMSTSTEYEWPLSATSMSLEGRTALVTGAGSGIGRSIAYWFASAGAAIAIIDLDKGSADTTARVIEDHGGKALSLATDVSAPGSAESALTEIMDCFQQVDVLVNNAGIYPAGQPIPELDAETFERTFRINVEGTFAYISAVSKRMNRGGSIINISSNVSIRPAGPGIAHYSASKAAVNGLTRSAAVDLAFRGIRVNAILPGIVATEGTQALADSYESFAARTPSGRIGSPEDIASAALFLACPASSFVNGQCLVVDGGASIVG